MNAKKRDTTSNKNPPDSGWIFIVYHKRQRGILVKRNEKG